MTVNPHVRYFLINPSGNLSLTTSLKDALAATRDTGYFWADYCEPTAESLAELIPELGIHPLSVEDCLNEDQLPKLDSLPTYSFMIFNIFEQTAVGVKIHELDLILGEKFLVTVSHKDETGQHLLKGMEKSIERESHKAAQGPAFLMHLIVDKVVDYKFNALEAMEEKLDEDEDRILNRTGTFDPASLMDSRRDLLQIRKSLYHEREVISKIIRQDSPFIPDKALIYFRDVYDHLSKYYEMSESTRDLVTSLMEIHLSIISNTIAETSNLTNAIMRRLTLITTIFMPLSLISGIGGMSEFTMFIGQQNWKIGYFVLLLVMVVIAGINYMLLSRMEEKLRSGIHKL